MEILHRSGQCGKRRAEELLVKVHHSTCMQLPGDAAPRLPRRRLHQITFVCAGIYNIAWGLFSVVEPEWLFRFAGMPLLNYPAIFACLGMVVGLYGIVYLEVARLPERGWLLAAVGFTGKVLGPIGLAGLIFSHAWPPATIVLSLSNDVVWWIPFSLYLYDARPWRGGSEPAAARSA
jgi:hypothetical protein